MQSGRQHSFSATRNPGTRLVLCCTSWSTPCRQQWKILDTLCDHYGNDTAITRIDIDHSPEFADSWAIQTIPTTLLLNGDRKIDRFIGLLSADRLKTILGNRVHPAKQVAQQELKQRR